MHSDEARNKDKSLLEEYHFSGSGEYLPLTIRARDREEAEAIWRQQRIKVELSQALPTNE